MHSLRVNANDETKFYSNVGVAGLFIQTLARIDFQGCSSRDKMYEYLGLASK